MVALVVGIILQVSVIMVPFLAVIFKVVPLDNVQWLLVAGLSIAPLPIVELEKALRQRQKVGQ